VTAPRPIVWAIAFEAVVTLALIVVAVDVNLHDRLEGVAGQNTRGYRGALRLTAPGGGQHRLLMVGDASTFGFGVSLDESLPSYLRYRLWVRGRRTDDKYSVQMINAAAVPDAAYALRYAIRDYARFRPDIVIIDGGYDGFCEGCAPNRSVSRHRSAIFRSTGYWPIVPQYLEERGTMLEARSSYPARFLGVTLAVAGRTAAALDEAAVFGRRALSAEGPERRDGIVGADGRVELPREPSCGPRWSEYCGAIAAAVDEALAHPATRHVVVMTPPYLSDRHREQQRVMAAMIAARFGASPLVSYLDAGDAIDLRDPTLALGGGIRTMRGNQELGEQILGRLLPLVTE
jgi:hypothetical protein